MSPWFFVKIYLELFILTSTFILDDYVFDSRTVEFVNSTKNYNLYKNLHCDSKTNKVRITWALESLQGGPLGPMGLWDSWALGTLGPPEPLGLGTLGPLGPLGLWGPSAFRAQGPLALGARSGFLCKLSPRVYFFNCI